MRFDHNVRARATRDRTENDREGEAGRRFRAVESLTVRTTNEKKYTKKPVSYVGYLNHRLSAPCNGIRIPEFIREIFNYGIRNPAIFLPVESAILGFGIRNPTNDWNPESKFHRQSMGNPVPCGIRNPRRGIQNARV